MYLYKYFPYRGPQIGPRGSEKTACLALSRSFGSFSTDLSKSVASSHGKASGLWALPKVKIKLNIRILDNLYIQYIYIYTCIHTCVYIYIYTYIYILSQILN